MRENPILDKALSVTATVFEYSKAIEQCTASEMTAYYSRVQGASPFHSVFDYQDTIAIAKIKILFKYAKKLNLDPNLQFNPVGFSDNVRWNNTPLHIFIANGRYAFVKPFLDNALEQDFKINLNLGDREQKTPFLLAVKMANAPIEVLELLITQENYNVPELNGMTPIMLASALRRTDVIKLILQTHATSLGLGKLNFNQLTAEQKFVLASFINQQHQKTGKSLLHFAVLREGDELDRAKPLDYQQTVTNILKAVGVDGRRDVCAKLNSALNDDHGIITFGKDEIQFFKKMNKNGLQLSKLGLDNDPDQLEMIFTDLAWQGDKKVENAILASKRNSFVLKTKTNGDNAGKYQKLHAQILSYKGITLCTEILSRTSETVDFLISIGIATELKQELGNKTTLQYIEALSNNPDQTTKADRKYILPISKKIKGIVVESPSHELSNTPLSTPTPTSTTPKKIQL